tara:strand:+ start:1187 stop:2350 length:1164 start_codon:yes stop_codon:yes gene_type:complete
MTSKNKISIIGHGYVGKAMEKFFEGHCDIIVYDTKYIEDISSCQSLSLLSHYIFNEKDKEHINDSCNVALICLPTPQAKDGTCDISAIVETLEWLYVPTIIIKSTIEPGTTDKLQEVIKLDHPNVRLVFSPEFCGESSYWTPYRFHTDVAETPFFIFGGPKEETAKCVDLYMQIAGPTKKYIQTDAKSAEMMKYVENCFYATKIMFCHEIEQICKKADLDYNNVRELWLNDPRLNSMHTAVFSSKNDGEPVVGGKCVPGYVKIKIKYNDGTFAISKSGKAILTESGKFKINKPIIVDMSIQDYYKFDQLNDFNVSIESTDSKVNKIQWRKINRVTDRNINEDIYVFETSVGSFECTAEHLIPVKRDGKKIVIPAKDIEETDRLFSKY